VITLVAVRTAQPVSRPVGAAAEAAQSAGALEAAVLGQDRPSPADRAVAAEPVDRHGAGKPALRGVQYGHCHQGSDRSQRCRGGAQRRGKRLQASDIVCDRGLEQRERIEPSGTVGLVKRARLRGDVGGAGQQAAQPTADHPPVDGNDSSSQRGSAVGAAIRRCGRESIPYGLSNDPQRLVEQRDPRSPFGMLLSQRPPGSGPCRSRQLVLRRWACRADSSSI
jgi:hypothetical protein